MKMERSSRMIEKAEVIKDEKEELKWKMVIVEVAQVSKKMAVEMVLKLQCHR